MRAAQKTDVDDFQVKGLPVSDDEKDPKLEMQKMQAAKQPFTPRTLAFNTLDRQLPLRYA